MDFYGELKWCPKCRRYVNYLLSTYSSFCVKCGAAVQLFSKTDMKKFKKQAAPEQPAPVTGPARTARRSSKPSRGSAPPQG
jgi:hypothetical protein